MELYRTGRKEDDGRGLLDVDNGEEDGWTQRGATQESEG
jgi:hypothetical protein